MHKAYVGKSVCAPAPSAAPSACYVMQSMADGNFTFTTGGPKTSVWWSAWTWLWVGGCSGWSKKCSVCERTHIFWHTDCPAYWHQLTGFVVSEVQLPPDGRELFLTLPRVIFSLCLMLKHAFLCVCGKLPGPGRRAGRGVRNRGAASSSNPDCRPGVRPTAWLVSGSHCGRCWGEKLLFLSIYGQSELKFSYDSKSILPSLTQTEFYFMDFISSISHAMNLSDHIRLTSNAR